MENRRLFKDNTLTLRCFLANWFFDHTTIRIETNAEKMAEIKTKPDYFAPRVKTWSLFYTTYNGTTGFLMELSRKKTKRSIEAIR